MGTVGAVAGGWQNRRMATWEQFSNEAPELAAAVRARFEANRHHVLATLQRDGRFALHANPGDGSMEGGDVKVAGHAVEVTDPGELRAFVEAEHPPEPFHLFRLSLDEVVRTSVSPDEKFLIIETWRPGRPLHRVQRQ